VKVESPGGCGPSAVRLVVVSSSVMTVACNAVASVRPERPSTDTVRVPNAGVCTLSPPGLAALGGAEEPEAEPSLPEVELCCCGSSRTADCLHRTAQEDGPSRVTARVGTETGRVDGVGQVLRQRRDTSRRWGMQSADPCYDAMPETGLVGMYRILLTVLEIWLFSSRGSIRSGWSVRLGIGPSSRTPPPPPSTHNYTLPLRHGARRIVMSDSLAVVAVARLNLVACGIAAYVCKYVQALR